MYLTQINATDYNLGEVKDVDGRMGVAKALDDFNAVQEKISEVTKSRYEKLRALEKIKWKIKKEISEIEQSFSGEYDAIKGYPDIDSPYMMHDDHLGCYCCELSGLPLRHDDELVDHGDGFALASLLQNKPALER